MKAPDQGDRDGGQAKRHAGPHPDPGERREKTQRGHRAGADPPIADHLNDHWDGGVLVAAQGAGGDRLQAVDQLKGGGDGEKTSRRGDRGGAVRGRRVEE